MEKTNLHLRKKVKTLIVKSTKSPELKQKIKLTHFLIVMAEPLLSETYRQRQPTPAAWRRALKTKYWITMMYTKSLRPAKNEGKGSVNCCPCLTMERQLLCDPEISANDLSIVVPYE